MGTATDALKERMLKAGKAAPVAAPVAREIDRAPVEEEPVTASEFAREFNAQEEYAESTPLSRALRKVSSVEVESVIGNALVRVRFDRGTNPAEVLDLLHLFDPGAQVRAEFPSKSFGPRETKSAPLNQIAFTKNGATISFGVDEDDLDTLQIWKNNDDKSKCRLTALIGKLKTCATINEKKLAIIEKSEEGKSVALSGLGLTVKYSENGGKRYYEDLVVETVKNTD